MTMKNILIAMLVFSPALCIAAQSNVLTNATTTVSRTTTLTTASTTFNSATATSGIISATVVSSSFVGSLSTATVKLQSASGSQWNDVLRFTFPFDSNKTKDFQFFNDTSSNPTAFCVAIFGNIGVAAGKVIRLVAQTASSLKLSLKFITR